METDFSKGYDTIILIVARISLRNKREKISSFFSILICIFEFHSTSNSI